MNPKMFSDRMVQMITPQDRKNLGLQTHEERMKKYAATTERELQRQIVQYLALRGIEAEWKRTDKKSTGTVGWPDITFAVKCNGIPCACAYEVKFGTGTLSRAQSDMLERMQASPNCWRVRVIRNFTEVVDDMREMGL